MFNAPRPAQPYGPPANGLGGSFVVDNPLAHSVYDSDGLDPWSAAPSPVPPALPSTSSGSAGLSTVINAQTVIPGIYQRAFAAVDSSGSGDISVNGLSRIMGTSGLPASTIDRIVSLVSSKPRVSRLEFYVALALVGLAQSGKDLSVERVALLAQENALPVPDLDLESLGPSTSSFTQYQPTAIRAPAPPRGYSSEDPWSAPSRFSGPTAPSQGSITNGASNIAGTGLPREWWKRQESVTVNTLGQQGFILNRYLVYEVSSDRGGPVPRRYSEFVFLWDCLVKRYPFRLLPALPPKRIGPDEMFLEQRRRGLARFINFVVNHPVIKEDGLLAVFLTEPSFETWRKQASISYEEESATKRIDRIEEMTIPSDLEEKLAHVRAKISILIEQWQRICILAERIFKRREAAAVRVQSSPFAGRTYMPAHFHLPPFSPTSSTSTATSSTVDNNDTESLASSVISTITHPLRHGNATADVQADTARLTNTLKALVELNDKCWRGEDCELCNGVRQGLGTVAQHTQRHADSLEERTRTLLYSTLESLKGQRDLYIAMRDLFIRHDRLSGDSVDKLKKRVEANSLKLEAVKQAQKDRWQEEADRISGLIEKDNATIAALLNRRVFIRACMWHELRVVLHNRENTLVTQTVKTFAREESLYSQGVAENWALLVEAVETMPFE